MIHSSKLILYSSPLLSVKVVNIISLAPCTHILFLYAQDLNVSDALSTLDNVNIGEIRELVDNTTQVFSNISGLLQEEIGEFGM